MRFLILTIFVTCAAAAPSVLQETNGILPYNSLPAASVDSSDVQAAAIDANVEVSNQARAAVDAAQELKDQAAEMQGKAINAIEENTWQAVDAVQTAVAEIDGAAASISPDAARLAVAPVLYSLPAVTYTDPCLSAYSPYCL